MSTLAKSFFSQFGHPRGAMGWLVGHLMAWKNGARSRWALELLTARLGENVLEIGFGPGVDVRRLLERVGDQGFVAGIDVSEEMVRQARARNRAAVTNGRSRLEHGSPEKLPFNDGAFNAVYSTNSAQFWPDLAGAMKEIHRVLTLSGRAVIVVQPMWRGATKADTDRWEEKLVNAAQAATFERVEPVRNDLPPAPAVAVIVSKGHNSD